MDGNNTSLIANGLATLIFAIPSLIFYFSNWPVALLLYNITIMWSLVNSVSRVKFETKSDSFAWKKFYSKLWPNKKTQKLINKSYN
jgi:hypothetical protein